MGSNPGWAKKFFVLFFYIFSFYSILYETIKISYKRWFFNIWHIFLFFKEKIMARAVVKRKTFISINIFDRFHFFWSFHLQHTPLKTNRHILGSSTFFGSFQPFFCSVKGLMNLYSNTYDADDKIKEAPVKILPQSALWAKKCFFFTRSRLSTRPTRLKTSCQKSTPTSYFFCLNTFSAINKRQVI